MYDIPLIDVIKYVWVCIASAGTLWIVARLIFSYFKNHNIVDKPHLYAHEQWRAPLPYPGGIVLVINMLLWLPWILTHIAESDIKKALYVSIAGIITSGLMAWDDRKRNISPIVRLLFQMCIGVFFWVTAIKIGYMTNIFGGMIHLDQFELLQFSLYDSTFYILPIVITCIWYVLVMNAINWSDNGRAMTSSIWLVTCCVLLLLAIKLYVTDASFASKNNSIFVMIHLIILIPSLFVFRMFDAKRMCIVGDAGTMYIGYMIATLAIVSGGKMATVSIVLGMYFIDAFYVILSRIRSGKNPMKWDTNHLHHRMSEQGIDHAIQRRIVMLLSFVFWVGAIFLGTWWKVILFLVMIAFVMYIHFFAAKLGKFLQR